MPQDGLAALQDIVQWMTQSSNFRTRIPHVLQLLCKQLDAGRAVFFEIAPITLRTTQLTFQRIIEVPFIGEAVEREIPHQLLRIRTEQAELEQWLQRLAAGKGWNMGQDTLVVSAIAGTGDAVKVLKSEKMSQAIIRALRIEFSTFLLFPLIREGTPSGLLFFLSTQSKTWDAKGVSVAQSGAQLLTHFLAQQYQENQRLLRNQFLIADRAALKDTVQIDHPPTLALLEEQKLYELITSTIPDFIFLVDIEQGKILFANTEMFLGYNIIDAGRPLDIFTNKIHPDDQSEAIGSFLHKLRDAEDGEIIQSEYRMQHTDGHWVWLNERAKVFGRFPDGIVKQYISVIQDITLQKEASLSIEKSEARYRNFVTYSNEGIYYINCGDPIPIYLPLETQGERFYAHAYLQECNDTLVKMFDYADRDTLTGVKIKYLDNVGALVSQCDFFSELRANDYKIINIETTRVGDDGSTTFFINQAIGIIERGHLVGIWGVQRDITAKRMAEKALRDSELRLTSIAQDARLGVWEWQVGQQEIHINQVGLELLEIGTRTSSTSSEEFLGWITEEDKPVLENALANHVSNNTDNFQVDIRMTATGRPPRWLQFHGRLVERADDGTPVRYSGTMLNIHELKIAELLVLEGGALLEAVLDAIPDTKLRVDVEGRILSVYGITTEQTHATLAMSNILGKNLKDLFLVFISKGLIFNAQKAIASGALQTFEFLDSRDGIGRYYEARFNRINEREAIIILRDITAIKLIEKELNEQINKYDLKNRQLEKYIESNLQLENFAYVASHDLREPIRTMRTFGQFLDRRIGKTLDKDAKAYLDFIISSADRMNHLIEDLLTYSKVNTEPLTREFIDTEKLLAEIIGSLDTRISETGAKVVIQAIPPVIYGSPSRMRQVFQNLIANAIKFHREGVPPSVVVSSTESPTHWEFSIADNGIGIQTEFFEQIFVIFKKLHNHEAYSGTGIGLALVKRIVAQHGGDVWLKSEEGVGTTFFFTVLK